MKKNKEQFYNYVMLAGLLLILISPLFVLPTYIQAKQFCNSVDGVYSWNFKGEHFCNKERINKYFFSFPKYHTYWDFEKNFMNFSAKINISNINP